MNTEPKIIFTETIESRSYVSFYFKGKRFREYNGNRLNLAIHPNRAFNIAERDKLLYELQYEIRKALENGWDPINIKIVEKSKSASEVLQEIIEEKELSSISWSYKRDLKSIHKKLLVFLTEAELSNDLSGITTQRLNQFLNQFDTTGTNYMNKRRALGVIFSLAVAKGYIHTNPILKTLKKKAKATLHKIYTEAQIKDILNFLKETYPNLHLCCLLTYGCLLRPHEESRLLRRNHFNEDITQIRLSGNENKSGRIRTVHIPNYVREALIERDIQSLLPYHNIISRSEAPYNVSYFSLQWSRAKLKMKKGILEQDQTIYSFRHSAAVNIYKKTKDIHILQQLLGHSNMIVTLKYLRGLGQLNLEEQKQYMPEL